MMRAVIYARYSTELQSDASIEDQIRMCDVRAKTDGYRVVQRYTDHAISGASMMRPGVQMLMQDAADGKFDVVIAEALDRISRDQEDIAAIFKRLSFADVRIVTLSEGDISHLHIGLKGTMNALFLKDLADKTRRGLRGRVEQGKSGGGKCYGYDVVLEAGERGGRVINETEAAIVRRIFEEYAAGVSPKAMAVRLNKEKVAGPSGAAWGPSTINGNRQRGTGVLNNELYIGKLVWNRLRYIKDPDTGKRVSRLNPKEQWVTHEVPDLRIVSEELWAAVKARQDRFGRPNEPLWKANRPTYLFSHLIKCGVCGGGCSVVSNTHIGCSNARNKGTCENRQTIKREALEEAVLNSLQSHLMDPELCKVFCEEYTKHLNDLASRHNASLAAYRRELEQVERDRKKLVKSILDGVPGHVLKDEATRIGDRKEELEAFLSQTRERPVLFHPNMGERYRQEIGRLIETLNDKEHRVEAHEIIRSLVDRIVLTPDAATGRPQLDLVGDLAGILGIAAHRERSEVSRELSVFNPDKQEAMVAGVGFEPTTFRL